MRAIKRIKTIKDFKDDITAPSSFAKHRGKCSWVALLKGGDSPLVCYRENFPHVVPPISLLCSVFFSFWNDSNSSDISEKDCRFATELSTAMCGSFKCEEDRMRSFIDIFSQFTEMELTPMTIDNSVTDGTLRLLSGEMICNLEVKNEKGIGGGDPYMQNIAYYFKSLDPKLSSPSLLLELCGTSFKVCGIINTGDIVICEPISRSYELLPISHSVLSLEIAQLLRAIKLALNKLKSFKFPPPSMFPFYCSFSIDDCEYRIKYLKQMKDKTYLARCGDDKVVIKFCTRYGQDVHRYCADLGFSPKLLFLDGSNFCYTIIVMEYWELRDVDMNQDRNLIKVDGEFILKSLRKAKFVHGDMRRTNLKVNKKTGKLVLLDFDWAGIDSKDKYPPFMNMDISWPDEAETGKCLKFQHDESWMRELINN